VPTRNAARTLEGCLESIKSNLAAEIIIVDGNSTDGTLEIARRYTPRIYFNNGQGVSYSRQIGAEQATQSYIAYIDADIILTELALSTMLSELISSGSDRIQATIMPARCDTYWEWAVDQHFHLQGAKINIGLNAGILKRELVLKTNFDLRIKGAGEDLDFIYRWERAGYSSAISAISVHHYHRASFKEFSQQRFSYGLSKPYLIKKYWPGKPELWPPAVMLYWLFFCLTRGKIKLIPYIIATNTIETLGLIRGSF
jgi:glycosyltransferase involved in cell wall biosynthesis